MTTFQLQKIKSFAAYLINNSLLDKISKIEKSVNNGITGSPRQLFLEIFAISDDNCKTEKKELYSFIDYYFTDEIDTIKNVYLLKIAIVEVLHERKEVA